MRQSVPNDAEKIWRWMLDLRFFAFNVPFARWVSVAHGARKVLLHFKRSIATCSQFFTANFLNSICPSFCWPVDCVEKFVTLNLDVCQHRGSVAHGVQKVGLALNVEPRFTPKTFTENSKNSNFSVTSTVSKLGEFIRSIELSRGRQLKVW